MVIVCVNDHTHCCHHVFSYSIMSSQDQSCCWAEWDNDEHTAWKNKKNWTWEKCPLLTCAQTCLTSTKPDTAALTKMREKSFTLQSNGTQTIWRQKRRDPLKLTVKIITATAPLEDSTKFHKANKVIKIFLLGAWHNVVLPQKTRQCFQPGGKRLKAGKHTRLRQTAQKALESGQKNPHKN